MTVDVYSAGSYIVSTAAGIHNLSTYLLYRTPYTPSNMWSTPHEFMDVVMPECISFGSKGGPNFNTSIFSVDSGMSVRAAKWENVRAKYEIDYSDMPSSNIEQLNSLFYEARGMAVAFLFKDWGDYIISNQPVFVGDGITSTIQIFKRYESGGHVFDRIIKKPRSTGADIAINGVTQVANTDYYLNTHHGNITFVVPPPVGSLVTILHLEFDVPVRFDSDSLSITPMEHAAAKTSVTLVEVLL